jgi:3-dehydroquinate dehydratase II
MSKETRNTMRKSNRILVINGPNLNLLGKREPEIYGFSTLKEINKMLKNEGKKRGLRITFYQSNHEGKIIDKIHSIFGKNYKGLIINPGALTHYSYSLRDAIKAINTKSIEIHITDIESREEFRKKSVLKDVCLAQIKGLGIQGYIKALELLQ